MPVEALSLKIYQIKGVQNPADFHYNIHKEMHLKPAELMYFRIPYQTVHVRKDLRPF